MGHRAVKRVPLNFEWPIGTIWPGFLSPDEHHFPPCPDCLDQFWGDLGTGLNTKASQIDRDFYALHLSDDLERLLTRWCDKITQDEVQALVDHGRLIEFTHDLVPGEGWVQKDPLVVPAAEEINELQRVHMVHDVINRWILVETRCRSLGVWGECRTCKGHGDIATDEEREAAENWKPEEPPMGVGWQLWETVTEGSPISPVFESPEELAGWCSLNSNLWPGHHTDKSTWLKLITGDLDMSSGSLLGVTVDGRGPLANME